MNPSIHLRIDSVIRALEDTVRPAIGSDERAAEQLQMSIAHLGVIRAQTDIAATFERFELACFEGLATTLLEASSGGPAVRDATRTLGAVVAGSSAPRDTADARERANRLGVAIEALIRAAHQDGDEEFRSAAMTALLISERKRVDANRAMFAGMAWEAGADLPDLAALVAEPARAL